LGVENMGGIGQRLRSWWKGHREARLERAYRRAMARRYGVGVDPGRPEDVHGQVGRSMGNTGSF
jgi:hypothetical protein